MIKDKQAGRDLNETQLTLPKDDFQFLVYSVEVHGPKKEWLRGGVSFWTSLAAYAFIGTCPKDDEAQKRLI